MDNVKVFVAITKKMKTLTGKSKNSVKNQIRERGILKKNVVLFKCCFVTNGNGEKEFQYKKICSQNFRLSPAHYKILKQEFENFLRKEFHFF
jgi:hypothetical protein